MSHNHFRLSLTDGTTLTLGGTEEWSKSLQIHGIVRATFITVVSDITVADWDDPLRLRWQITASDPAQDTYKFEVTEQIRLWNTGLYVLKIGPGVHPVHQLSYNDIMPEDFDVEFGLSGADGDSATFSCGMLFSRT